MLILLRLRGTTRYAATSACVALTGVLLAVCPDILICVWSAFLQIERQVEQKRASWDNLNDDQQDTVEELTEVLRKASAAEGTDGANSTAAELLNLLRL